MAARISIVEAREIRAKFKAAVAAEDGTIILIQQDLARQYGLGTRTVQSILAGRSWREPNQ